MTRTAAAGATILAEAACDPPNLGDLPVLAAVPAGARESHA